MIEEKALESVTRVEVIDDNGRAYTVHNIESVVLSLQDDQRTLKIFIKNTL